MLGFVIEQVNSGWPAGDKQGDLEELKKVVMMMATLSSSVRSVGIAFKGSHEKFRQDLLRKEAVLGCWHRVAGA